ncbi:hypothetical protein HDU93_000270 [Gonapodya sp. JEL0774]|nr:hypothetical protein HDU93_000270 [Gonapodya sp. JEL0774]
MALRWTEEDGSPDYVSITSLAWSVIFAAQINTLANMAWVLIRIAHDPVLAARVLAEQQAIFDKSQPGVPLSEVIPTQNDIAEMRLLDRIMAENIRLTNPLSGFRASTDEIHFNDYVIPANSWVTIMHSSIHYDATLYPDPMKFDPDRPVPAGDKADPSDLGVLDSGSFGYSAGVEKEVGGKTLIGEGSLHGNPNLLIWGTGRHPCLGARLAIFAVKTVVSRVVCKFDISLVDGTWPKAGGIPLSTIKPTNKVQLQLNLRSGATAPAA